ncbi:PHP domain-containing protein [Sedimentibacter sp. MB31-C6]|uniref:PHP domain-containing protein n=1 Tax=Sedimentibacter sp. MB31-C6 TaxID=3109366 RepID=UPI002DDDA4F2|nr:PHP domain-containing protein [Sedimentibacter sp. MB36-C1]WSI03627.1 PHP domain-containing protein [Sedimentibacter sp. MB36-C1]
MKVDLHIHTNISDSDYSIEETIRIAKENKLKYIGIVNHDTVKGLKEAIEIGKKKEVCIIPGIEISAYDFKRNKKVHILGYNFNLKAENIKALCNPIIERRNINSIRQINILRKNNYDISIEEVQDKAKFSTCIYKQHIMAVLMDKGYCSEIYSNLYCKLFKNGGICSGDIEYVDAFKAVEAIKNDEGKAILAHPGQLDSYEIMDELWKRGLDGIELYHEDHSAEDLIKILEYSVNHSVILTGGSDFHGTYSENHSCIGNITVPVNFVSQLL